MSQKRSEGSSTRVLDDSNWFEETIVEELDSESEIDELSAEEEVEDEIELDQTESEVETISETSQEYVSKSGFVWKSAPPPSSRTRSSNIVQCRPGPTHGTDGVKTIADSFYGFMTNEMLEEIVKYSNAEGQARYLRKELAESNWNDINVIELKAAIGLLFLMGLLGKNKLNMRQLWENSPIQAPIFKATMSRDRFETILSVLRFDNQSTREIRRERDKFAAIRDIWTLFQNNCKNNFQPYEYVTIDEQLLGFRGRCPFKQYIPSKPDKYGIKIWICADVKTCYVYNCMPYLGRQPGELRQENVGAKTVCALLEPLYNSGRNVTVDNFFTSVPLANELLSKKITLVGTLRKNKTEIPVEFLPNRRREIGSSLFGFQNQLSLVSFVPQKNKSVVLLSSMHHDNKIDIETGKPDMIITYNETKGAVDTVDQLCHKYSVKRGTRRWPLCVFFDILDICGINAMVIWKCKNPNWNKDKPYKRRLFIEELGMQLISEYLSYRASNPIGLQSHIRTAMTLVGYPCKEQKEPEPSTSLGKRNRCFLCPRSKDKKVSQKCYKCHLFVCNEHSHKEVYCTNCTN